MNPLEPVPITCPYCGETLELIIDSSAGRQEYIEDCHVCCQPIRLSIHLDKDGLPSVDAHRDNE